MNDPELQHALRRTIEAAAAPVSAPEARVRAEARGRPSPGSGVVTTAWIRCPTRRSTGWATTPPARGSTKVEPAMGGRSRSTRRMAA